MKKRAFQGFGLALLLASPMWVTYQERPDYLLFGLSAVLGVLLLVMSHYTPGEERRTRR